MASTRVSQHEDSSTHQKVKMIGISRNVVLAGFTSFFTDISTEMIYPLIQAFVSMIMGSQKALLGPILGIIEGVEKAFVSDIAPEGSKATALGFYHTIVGAGLLPASIIAGVFFSVLPSAPFLFGGATALVTVAVISFFVREG
jgi:hypothetical protein